MALTKQQKKEIKEWARHYHSPVSDIKGFNKLLKREVGVRVRKKTIAKLLGYS